MDALDLSGAKRLTEKDMEKILGSFVLSFFSIVGENILKTSHNLNYLNPTRGSLWNASRVAGGGADSARPYKNQFRGHFDPIF